MNYGEIVGGLCHDCTVLIATLLENYSFITLMMSFFIGFESLLVLSSHSWYFRVTPSTFESLLVFSVALSTFESLLVLSSHSKYFRVALGTFESLLVKARC